MRVCIMRFLNRQEELRRLDALAGAADGGLAVVYGRRRIGKTRLLVEWCRRHGGVYAVADQSAPDVQRRHLAQALAVAFPGFADVEYRDWGALFTRLAREARAEAWTGPVVLDELPYWVVSSLELPSVLQRWIDHEARAAGLVVAVAGSSQRMMQGLALSADAPLFGRARELFEVGPLGLSEVSVAIGREAPRDIIEFYSAWGGVPRYWELAVDAPRDVRAAIDTLVLDPRGPLHDEPDRLLLEEMPSALEVRPVLDAIGNGAHRVSEIAARIGRPATSISRPLKRLLELGLAQREIPFGDHERQSRRSLYRIADPFTRLWFRVVAPHRGLLVSGTAQVRRALLDRSFDGLAAATWEEACRRRLPLVAPRSRLGRLGPWQPASRWWSGNAPEWDVVAENVAGTHVLLGEAKLPARVPSDARIRRLALETARRQAPVLPARYRTHEIVRALFLPERPSGLTTIGQTMLVSLADLV